MPIETQIMKLNPLMVKLSPSLSPSSERNNPGVVFLELDPELIMRLGSVQTQTKTSDLAKRSKVNLRVERVKMKHSSRRPQISYSLSRFWQGRWITMADETRGEESIIHYWLIWKASDFERLMALLSWILKIFLVWKPLLENSGWKYSSHNMLWCEISHASGR